MILTKAILYGNNNIGDELKVDYYYDEEPLITPSITYTFYNSGDYSSHYKVVQSSNSNSYIIKQTDRYIKCKVFDGTSQVFTDIILVNNPSNNSVTYKNSQVKLTGAGCSIDNVIQVSTGRSKLVANRARINQSIKILLSTSKYEVPMITLGTDLYDKQFEGITDEYLSDLKDTVLNILRLEPRIEVTDVDCLPFQDQNLVKITIKYKIVDTNITSSYVFNLETI